MLTTDKIAQLKRDIISLRDREREENLKLILPIIRKNCIFKVSWLNHIVYCDDKCDDAEFKKKLDDLTIEKYHQYCFGDVYLSWWSGRINISHGRSFDYSCSDEEWFIPLIERCKELGLQLDFSESEIYLSEKKKNIELDIVALERLKNYE